MKRAIGFVLVSSALVFVVGCGAGRKSQWSGGAPAAAVAAGETPDALLATADAAWAKRGEKASLEGAITALEKASALKPEDASILARLSRAYFFYADAHQRKLGTSSAEYLGAFEKGTSYGERALAESNPAFKAAVTSGKTVEESIKLVGVEGLDAMYWYAANLGKWSKAKGFATTLGNKDRIKAVMSRALELDESFFNGAPHRYFGAFYSVAPSFAGGDVNKSKEHFEKSLSISPNYAGTKVLMAETYAVKTDDQKLFEKLLDEVIALDDSVIPGYEPETRNEKEKAKELKAKSKEMF